MIYLEILAITLIIAWVVLKIQNKIDDINEWNQKRLEKKRLAEINKFKNRKKFVDI